VKFVLIDFRDASDGSTCGKSPGASPNRLAFASPSTERVIIVRMAIADLEGPLAARLSQ
jgi:hypothetical protein